MATSMMNHTQAEESMKPILDFALHSCTTASQNLTTFTGFGELMQSMDTLETMSLNHYQAAASMSWRIVPHVNFQGTANKHRLVECSMILCLPLIRRLILHFHCPRYLSASSLHSCTRSTFRIWIKTVAPDPLGHTRVA